MLAEREHLLPLAAEGFDLAALHFPHVNQSGCVKVLTNFYSTPLPVGTTVDAKVYSAYVEIWHDGHCVARHERCYERHQQVLELDHYLDVLEKKPGALAGSTALEQCRAQGRWPASYDRFWSIASERDGRQAGTRAMIEVLLLSRTWARPRAPGGGRGAGDGRVQPERDPLSAQRGLPARQLRNARCGDRRVAPL